MSKRYTQQELNLILLEFKQGTPLSELENKLNRSSYSIAMKIRALSKQYPETYNPERVAEYRREGRRQYRNQNKDKRIEEKRRYNERHRDELREKARRYWRQSRKQHKEDHQQIVQAYLKEHPDATSQDFLNTGLERALMIAYKGRIDRARRDVDIATIDYVSASEATQMLGVTRQRISQLLKEHKLDGYRLGRFVFISLKSVEDGRIKTNHSGNV